MREGGNEKAPANYDRGFFFMKKKTTYCGVTV